MANPDGGQFVPHVQKDPPEYGETQPPRRDIREQRGGPQDNQITGQTEKGAKNQETQGRNPPDEEAIRDNGP